MTPRGAVRRSALALALVLTAAVAQANEGERYLVIGASASSPGAIAKLARALAGAAAGEAAGIVLNTADCGDRRSIYVWAASVADSAAAARTALAQLREHVPDAWIKRCLPRPGSLFALGVPAVDPSIADVPDDAVNWRDADRVSSVLALGDPAAPAWLVLQRVRVSVPDDPLEGRRTRLLLLRPGAAPQVLLEDCSGARGAVHAHGWLALACDSEQAADHVLHTVHAFSADGAPVLTVERCRAPRITGPDTLECEAETVDAQGRLRLTPRSAALGRP